METQPSTTNTHQQNTSATIKEVSIEPEVKIEKQDLVSVFIDREMTDGGIRINEKLYVGTVKVPKAQAEDLLRIQEEYFETKKKLMDKNISIRMKNDHQKEALFLADPKENANKKGWSRDYGLLTPLEWSYCKPEFKKHLLSLRKQYFGY
jgi:hypothetical protein